MEAGGGNGAASSSFDDFNIDKQEYQSVFKVFDKTNSGEISIGQVFELINKFDQAQKLTEQASSSATNNNGTGGAGGVAKNQEGTLRQNTMGGGVATGYKGTTAKPGGNQTANNKNSNMNGNSPTIKKATQQTGAANANGFGIGGAGIQLKPTAVDHCKLTNNTHFLFSRVVLILFFDVVSSKSPRMISGVKPS